MQIQAHLMMVMALDKCIGCHTCSIGCKQAWTNRDGTDYMWWNNVETKPGAGYPRRWEDQKRWKGGWGLGRKGRLRLRAGGRGLKLATIFANLDLPLIDDYYEPWTYDYATLTEERALDAPPVATARSRITGKPMDLHWGPNWEDDLAGVRPEHDPVAAGMEERLLRRYQEVFLFYLPRICNHCVNPSCVASCPSGAMYKRTGDGIVLVDQDRCRGWRFCVSGCPYKKVYFNPVTAKAEKCIFCYAGVTEDGLPTICSETCVGRIRYLGVVLYDLDQVTALAETASPADLVEAQRALFLDPHDPRVAREAERCGVAHEWLEAARHSPVYALAKELRVALPLHPEFRTLPMVWYVPPLSPLLETLGGDGDGVEGGSGSVSGPGGTGGAGGAAAAGAAERLFAGVDEMRIPLQYLANLLSAGDVGPVREALERQIAMRTHKRGELLGNPPDWSLLQRVGLHAGSVERMYQLLAIADRQDRYVIPRVRSEEGGALQTVFGRGSGQPGPGAGDDDGSSAPPARGRRRTRRGTPRARSARIGATDRKPWAP